MKDVDYIEHEVKLRVMQEVNDVRFTNLHEAIKDIDTKFVWIIGIFLGSIIVPVALHFLKLI